MAPTVRQRSPEGLGSKAAGLGEAVGPLLAGSPQTQTLRASFPKDQTSIGLTGTNMGQNQPR